MADYNYMTRGSNTAGGRFGMRPPTSSSTYSRIEDERSSQSSAMAVAEVYEERVGVPFMVNTDGPTRPNIVVLAPQHKIDGFVTKKETVVERVYVPSEPAYRYGSVTIGEASKDYTFGDGGQGKHNTSTINEFLTNIQTEIGGSNRGAFPRGLLQRQIPNSPNSNSCNNDGDTNVRSEPIKRSTDDGTNTWSRPSGGGVNGTGKNSWSKPTGGGINEAEADTWNKPSIGNTTKEIGKSETGKQTGVGAKDIGTNSWNGPTAGNIGSNGLTRPIGGTSDLGANGWGKPAGSSTNEIKTNQSSRPGGELIKESSINRDSPPSAAAGGSGGTDTGSKGSSRPTDALANDMGSNSKRMPIGGTANGIATKDSKPTDGLTNTGTNPWPRQNAGTNVIGTTPGVGSNTSSLNPWTKPSGGPNDTGVDRSGQPGGYVDKQSPFYPSSPVTSKQTRPPPATQAPWAGRFTPAKPMEIIDSNEAARRYNGIIAPPPRRSSIIDSNEAARKYSGAVVR